MAGFRELSRQGGFDAAFLGKEPTANQFIIAYF
jgi:hypothetical protein